MLLLGHFAEIISEEARDEQTTARVLQRLDREVFGGPERLEARADKPWLR